MKSLLSYIFKKRDGVNVLGKVGPADQAVLSCSSMGVDPAFIRARQAIRAQQAKKRKRPGNSAAYPFKDGGQANRIVLAFSRGRHLTNASAREICGGMGSRGERRLAEARAWLNRAGYIVQERRHTANAGGRYKSFWLATPQADALRAFLRKRGAKA